MLRHIITMIVFIARRIDNFIPKIGQKRRARDLLIVTNRVMSASRKFGYHDDSETTEAALYWFTLEIKTESLWYKVATPEEVERRFNPNGIGFVDRTLDQPPLVTVRPDRSGTELYQKIIELNFGDTLKRSITKVVIGHHTTEFFDDSNAVVVEFYAAGRKMDGSDNFRVRNAWESLRLLGIDSDGSEIAQRDSKPGGYEPLVFEKIDGEWRSYELEAIPG